MDNLAVVILNYNGASFLTQFLPSIIQYSDDATIYVADNQSTDNSLEILAAFPEIKTIVLEENLGYAGGYNAALEQIKAKYYALVNSDIEVTPHWIDPIIEFLEKNPSYGAAQPKLLDYKNKKYFEYAGAAGGYLDLLGYPYCRGRIFDHLEKDVEQYDSIIDIFWASGACLFVRSEVFQRLGGFDKDFFAHMEEIDLCWRMKNYGYRVACIPNSTVYHVGGGTLSKTNERKTYLNFRNGLSLLLKNCPKIHLIWIMPVRIVLDWAASVLFWKNHSTEHFLAVWKAQLTVLTKIRFHLKEKPRSTALINNQKPVILPLEYYLRKKKTFNEINNTK